MSQAPIAMPSPQPIEIFSARVCPYAHRTRLLLIEKDVPFELFEINLKDKPPRFLEVSPYGKVPAIVHNGVTIYESAIINEYLDETFPHPTFMPADPAGRAKARIWIDYCDDYFIDDHYALLKNTEPGQHASLLQTAQRNLRFIEVQGLGKLGGDGPYWFGAEASLVDFAWYPFFERLPAWTHYRGLTIPDDCPRLKAWVDVMSKRASVRQIANEPDYYVGRYLGYAKSVLTA